MEFMKPYITFQRHKVADGIMFTNHVILTIILGDPEGSKIIILAPKSERWKKRAEQLNVRTQSMYF